MAKRNFKEFISSFIDKTCTYYGKAFKVDRKDLYVKEYLEACKGMTQLKASDFEDAFKKYTITSNKDRPPMPHEIMGLLRPDAKKLPPQEDPNERGGVPVPPEVVKAFFKEVYEPPVGHSETFDKWARENNRPLIGDVEKEEVPRPTMQEAVNGFARQKRKDSENVQSLYGCTQHELSEDKRI